MEILYFIRFIISYSAIPVLTIMILGVILQIYIIRKENKYLWMLCPFLSFTGSVIYVIRIYISGQFPDRAEQTLFTFGSINIYTLLLIIVYMIHKRASVVK